MTEADIETEIEKLLDDQLVPSAFVASRGLRVKLYNAMVNLCESPIERRLLIDLVLMDTRYVPPPHALHDCSMPFPLPDRMVVISPQFPINSYRVDFAIFANGIGGPSLKIAVECDGHDFHERTKEQAAKDKARDRYLVSQYWRVLRFTGSEIHNDSAKCAKEVAYLLRDFFGRRFSEWPQI